MNLGKTFTVGAMTLGLSFGALVLGTSACGSTTPATNGTATGTGEKPDAGSTTTTGGGETKQPESNEDHTCGAGSCGKLRLQK